jgi:signal transduction histidine kinase
MLDLQSDGVLVRAAVPRWRQNWVLPGYLRGLPVTVRGVVSRKPVSLEDGAMAEQTVLCTPSLEMIEVASAGLDKLFKRPSVAYTNFFQFTTWEKPLIRIQGQVRFARPGLGFFVLMTGGIVWVQTSAPGKLAPGDMVDAVGWLDVFDGRPLLTDATFRVDKPGKLTFRPSRKASEIKVDLSASNHGTPISVQGRLIEQQRSVSEDSLVMEDQGVMFLARLLHDGGAQLPVLERGMRLRLAGMCVAKRMPLQENLPSTFAFQLWLSSPADVEIIERPSWWTVRRVFGLCGVLLFLGLLAAGWAALLRRQVARQTAVISSQREREAVSQERARIARELHDSLGQELVGIALQLDSAALRLREAPKQAEAALNTARSMVRHSQAETKRSVADLRAGELDSTDLPTALEELLQPMIAAVDSPPLHMEVQGTPRRLEAVTEHHLLRIGQEVVANALRHAQAGKIEVLVCYRESEVMLEVKDDGRGFDTKQALDISSGHFGLLGLRERANKLGGKLRIDSRPWAGTAVSLTVPLNIHFPK